MRFRQSNFLNAFEFARSRAQGIAFGNRFSKCLNCDHPRCLICIDFDIEAINYNAQSNPEDTHPVLGRDMLGCLFCVKQ